MFRQILPVLAGLVVAMVMIGLVEFVGMVAYPPPPGVMSNDPAVVKDAISRLPVESFVFMLVAYGLGTFVGGYTAAYISRRNQMTNALIVGGLLFLAGLFSLVQIPSPLWFSVLSQLLYLPCAYAGARVGEHL